MKKILAISILVVILSVSIISVAAQNQYEIPSWVKGIAGFWAEEKITDAEFGEGLTFLIENNIINVPKIQELENRISQLENENRELQSKLGISSQPEYYSDYSSEMSLTVTTDKSSYREGEVVKISGQVSTIVIGTPVTIQLFGNEYLVDITQASVFQDGSYSYVVVAGGPLWIKGNYIVSASYGEGNTAETNFSYSPKQSTSSYSSQNCSGIAKCVSETVTQIVDGDTIYTTSYKIRLSLTNTPESNELGFATATTFTSRMCPVGSTILIDQDDRQPYDQYGRLLANVYCGGESLNSALLYNDYANILTQYCSTSEFSSERWAQDFGCGSSSKATSQSSQTTKPSTSQSQSSTSNCDPSYPDFCIPSSPPDLDCKDIPQKRFTVLQPDPHGFDRDNDGIGCES